MKKRAVATVLLLIGVLASACTGGDPRARDAPELAAPAASSRVTSGHVGGPATGHAHHHAHHAHGSSELRTGSRATQ